MFKLTKKQVIITGGGSGIGKAMSILFAKQGATVHIIELNEEAASDTVNEIKAAGGNAAVHKCDVSNQQQVLDIFNSIGKIDILVNNAGIAHIGKADNTS
ncbi:MAG: SDR family NAD(P)-dependent oxidoreductase, partial [Mucilaginibacter sp.]